MAKENTLYVDRDMVVSLVKRTKLADLFLYIVPRMASTGVEMNRVLYYSDAPFIMKSDVANRRGIDEGIEICTNVTDFYGKRFYL